MALDRAARENPMIYKPRRPSPQQPGGDESTASTKRLAGGGVTYPEEYEGNEPMDESWQQEPYLEPTEAPSLGISVGDDSGQRYSTSSHRRRSVLPFNTRRPSSSRRRVSESRPDDENHLRGSAKRNSMADYKY